ncbi:MAG: carboxypeptidase regulatory-like domain-containing protein [Candidatus Acidiferrum sp.]
MRTLCLCLGLWFAAVASFAAQQAESGYRISGVVIDAVTHTPVAHAQVAISVGAEETKTTSGEDGRFVFQGVEPGKYPLFASAQGYIREGYNQHGAFLTAIAVGPALDSEHVILRLHRQSVLTGKVTDEHGEPVRSAQVMLFGNDKSNGRRGISIREQVQANDLGEYRFAHLHAGKYYLAVQAQPWYAFNYMGESGQSNSSFVGTLWKPDPALDVVYPITFYPGVKEADAAAELNLTSGDMQVANIQLQAVPAVHIRLTNSPAHAESGISIQANQKLFGSLIMPVSSISAQVAPGEYEVAGLPPGDVTLVVNAGGNKEQHSRTIKANVVGSETLDAAESGALANVSGRVILPAGEAISGHGRVMFFSDDGQNASATLQKDGTFSFASLQEGTYKVMVNTSVNDEYVKSISATGAKISAREITVAGGDVQISITMGRGQGEITGVAKLDDKPAAGMMVLLVPASGQNLEEDSRLDQTDSDGTFTLPAISPGKYSLVAIEDGWDLEWTNAGILKPYLGKAQSLQISANDKLKVTVEVQRKLP